MEKIVKNGVSAALQPTPTSQDRRHSKAAKVDRQVSARHDVQDAVDGRLRHEGALRSRAVFGIALLILRPQPVQDESEGPRAWAALGLVWPRRIAGAEGRAP